MMRRLLPLVLGGALALLVAAPAGAAYAPGGPVVLRDNMASQMKLVPPPPTGANGLHPQVIEPDTEIEPSIAVNPANPLNAVAVFQEGRVDGGGDETNQEPDDRQDDEQFEQREAALPAGLVAGRGC